MSEGPSRTTMRPSSFTSLSEVTERSGSTSVRTRSRHRWIGSICWRVPSSSLARRISSKSLNPKRYLRPPEFSGRTRLRLTQKRIRSGVTARILAAVRVEKVSPPPASTIFNTIEEYRQSGACSQRGAPRFLNTCGAYDVLAADFLERASDADDRLDAVLGVVDPRDGLIVGHAGAGDGEADRLVELEGELDAGAGDRVRDELVVQSFALDDRADHHDAVDFLALQQSFHDGRHVIDAGNVDDARDFGAERLGVAPRALFHRRGHFRVELRNYERDFHFFTFHFTAVKGQPSRRREFRRRCFSDMT